MIPGSEPGIHKAVLRLLADEPRGRLLDAAAGTGALIPKLLDLGFQAEACDIDPHAYRLSNPGCRAVDLNAPLPYPDRTIDIIVCVEALEHLISPRHTLREFGRVLRPGGCLIISTPNVQSMFSRFHFLLVGTLDFFDTLPPGDTPSFWFRRGHISPIL
jgi:SAM-dependent methyltransferase